MPSAFQFFKYVLLSTFELTDSQKSTFCINDFFTFRSYLETKKAHSRPKKSLPERESLFRRFESCQHLFHDKIFVSDLLLGCSLSLSLSLSLRESSKEALLWVTLTYTFSYLNGKRLYFLLWTVYTYTFYICKITCLLYLHQSQSQIGQDWGR